MVELPEGTIILLRRAMTAEPGEFERGVANLAHVLHLEVQWGRPAPAETHPGRASVYYRDMLMVEQADFAVLFFTRMEHEGGYSGTMHLLDKCLDAGRPVHAYTVGHRTGEVERVGDYDPEHQFDHLSLKT
jgi:hypothetical protein